MPLKLSHVFWVWCVDMHRAHFTHDPVGKRKCFRPVFPRSRPWAEDSNVSSRKCSQEKRVRKWRKQERGGEGGRQGCDSSWHQHLIVIPTGTLSINCTSKLVSPGVKGTVTPHSLYPTPAYFGGQHCEEGHRSDQVAAPSLEVGDRDSQIAGQRWSWVGRPTGAPTEFLLC